MEHTKHLWRAFLIILALLIGGVVWRHFMIPESFGQEGHFRYDSLLEHMRKTPVHGEIGACAKCHEEQQKSRDGDKHATVSCESCHSPLGTHVASGKKTGEMHVDKSYRLCTRCHLRLQSRPQEFPQIVLSEHLATLEISGEIPEKVCKACHDPHKPSKR